MKQIDDQIFPALCNLTIEKIDDESCKVTIKDCDKVSISITLNSSDFKQAVIHELYKESDYNDVDAWENNKSDMYMFEQENGTE